MRQPAKVIGFSLFWLILLDLAVAGILALNISALDPLARYFHLGRSVPGKLALWQGETELSADNLFELGWLPDAIAGSTTRFGDEPRDLGPVVRSYGMSFVNNILFAASAQDPGLNLDLHAGPMAPPNWTYSAFLDDRANRRAGDIVVFGILSSAVPAMEAMSNRTWGFEQPAPVTYPIYRPEGADAVQRIDPLVQSAQAERALLGDPAATAAWAAQLKARDAFYSGEAFGLPALDISPFARLVRRAAAWSAIDATTAQVLKEDLYWSDVLRRMVGNFARIAREDGQVPVVMLVQDETGETAHLLEVLRPVLNAGAIPYFATVDHADPANPANFIADGHYTHAIDARFGAAFLELPEVVAARAGN